LLELLIALLMTGEGATAPDPSAVVRSLYREVVVRHPLGVPSGEDAAALEPFLSEDLRRLFGEALRCEGDYYGSHAGSDEKPPFPWLEDGLFSGPNEMALPAEFEIEGTKSSANDQFEVVIRFTYKETFETYGRPPDPRNNFDWRGVVSVRCEEGECRVDDFRVRSAGADEGPSLRELFRNCVEGRWTGE